MSILFKNRISLLVCNTTSLIVKKNDLIYKISGCDRFNLIHPKVPELFEKIRINNITIALTFNDTRKLQKKIIQQLDMEKYIDNYISKDEVTYGSPFPYMIHHIMEKHKIGNVVNVAKIGDTIDDMKEGKNAGCGLIIGVLSESNTKAELKKFGADIVVDNIMDLNNNKHVINDFLL